MFSSSFLVIVSFLLVAWVYKDCDKWRTKGVNATPLLFSFGYLVFLVAFNFLNFGKLFSPVEITIKEIIPLFIPILIYILVREFVFKKRAGNKPPLPKAPRAHSWVLWILVVIPLAIVSVVGIFILLMFFGLI